MRLRLTAFLLLLAACSGNAPESETMPGRWYTEAQVLAGESLYQNHCAVCHAVDGSATAAWRTPDAAGNYPPPPLNGTAHTWHHPLEVLEQTIANGSIEFGGVMPGFSAALSGEDHLAIIAWFQNLWPDNIYAQWQAIDDRSRN